MLFQASGINALRAGRLGKGTEEASTQGQERES